MNCGKALRSKHGKLFGEMKVASKTSGDYLSKHLKKFFDHPNLYFKYFLAFDFIEIQLDKLDSVI